MPSTFGEPCTPNGAVANQQQSDRPRWHAELCVLVEALTRFGAVHSSRHGAQLKWEDMTKAEFIETLAQNLGQTRSESERVLESVVEVLRQALQRGEKIDLRGLGVFKVRESKPRQARNPRTGEPVSIPAKKAAVFKQGKELSALLNTTAEGSAAQPKNVEPV